MIRKVQVGSAALSVHDEGTGIPLLFVHGFPLDHTMWQGQLSAFAKDYRVIAPDLTGFGKSDPLTENEYRMEQFADDLAEMLRQLQIDEPVIFCGLSMGGYIALQFWRNHRQLVRQLIFCDTKATADTEEIARGRRYIANQVVREGSGAIAKGMLGRLFGKESMSLPNPVVAATEEVMRSTAPTSIAAAQRGMAARPDMMAELSQIAVPTLVVVGEEDAISTVAEMESMANAISNARFQRIDNAGHMAPLEQPEKVNQAIREFLVDGSA